MKGQFSVKGNETDLNEHSKNVPWLFATQKGF